MKYTYKILSVAEVIDWNNPEDGLNDLGKDGWELCLEINGRLIFKRRAGIKVSDEAILKFLKTDYLGKTIE